MAAYIVAAVFIAGLHCLYVSATRFARLRDIQARYGDKYSYSDEEKKRTGKPRMIDSYQGVRDAQRIVRLASLFDAPFVFTKAIEFALFKTYGIPTISGLLAHTGQFSRKENAGRRFADTAGLINSFLTYPLPRLNFTDEDKPDSPDSWECIGEDTHDPRSSIAIARMNFLHSRWSSRISNDDLLYTLSVFVVEPPVWIDRYEWRKMSILEKEALFALMYHIGQAMGIRDIPDTRVSLEDWAHEYDENNTVFAESNVTTAEYTVQLLLYGVPELFQPFGRKLVASLMPDRLRTAFGIEAAPRAIVLFKDMVLGVRAALIRHFALPRARPLSPLPLGCDADKNEFSIEKALQKSLGVCPASGALATDEKTCPVGGAHPSTAAVYRMENKWYENEPIYSRPHAKGSAGWLIELAKVRLDLMPAEDRRGSSKWRASTLPQQPSEPIEGLGGYRLEEMGPKGLETKGREQVLRNAEQLHGRPLTGPWAFSA